METTVNTCSYILQRAPSDGLFENKVDPIKVTAHIEQSHQNIEFAV